jgi:hypothetical protein
MTRWSTTVGTIEYVTEATRAISRRAENELRPPARCANLRWMVGRAKTLTRSA